MTVNKTHLGAFMLGTGIFLGLTGAAIVASDKRDHQETEEDCNCEECECSAKRSDIPTMSNETVE